MTDRTISKRQLRRIVKRSVEEEMNSIIKRREALNSTCTSSGLLPKIVDGLVTNVNEDSYQYVPNSNYFVDISEQPENENMYVSDDIESGNSDSSDCDLITPSESSETFPVLSHVQEARTSHLQNPAMDTEIEIPTPIRTSVSPEIVPIQRPVNKPKTLTRALPSLPVAPVIPDSIFEEEIIKQPDAGNLVLNIPVASCT
ncbi:unnamed protein product [Allacma fusca]|uniref:Uncharacterized protein n=1 Tax=Allacma fusca TaxID=39272 RepID=A0A8J2J7Y9_9HEXA|nr:unnamed protein product [Allacma fusca]